MQPDPENTQAPDTVGAPEAETTPKTSEGEPAPDSPAAPTDPGVTWESLGLSEITLELIRKAGFTHPTRVQAQALPVAMAGRDLIASSQTGSGKTASFVLPMVERFAGREGTYGLVLAPTRELAQQCKETLDLFAAPRGLRSCVLIGGVNYRHDEEALATYPQIIVATPGRLCDHLDRGNIWLEYIEIFVLDEADRMLDMGFADQLARITEELPKDRQTLLFSATIPPAVKRLADRTLHEPVEVTIGKPLGANRNVDQSAILLSESDKNRELRRILRQEPGSIIVFTRSKDGATRVWRSLHSNGIYDATYIHSDRLQKDREQALAEFKEGKYRVLIATDVAARGIHVDDVAMVVNYDLPMESEDYIHRIGRTGRMDKRGKSITFITPRDRSTVARIEKLLGQKIPVAGGLDRDRGASRDNGRDRGGRDRQGRDHGRSRDSGAFRDAGGAHPAQVDAEAALSQTGEARRGRGDALPPERDRPRAASLSELTGGAMAEPAPLEPGFTADERDESPETREGDGSVPQERADEGSRRRRRRRRGRRGRGGGSDRRPEAQASSGSDVRATSEARASGEQRRSGQPQGGRSDRASSPQRPRAKAKHEPIRAMDFLSMLDNDGDSDDPGPADLSDAGDDIADFRETAASGSDRGPREGGSSRRRRRRRRGGSSGSDS